ncbi:MAG: MBL fold metallo-hydrolase, partial [Desulfoferrobacter sp.]
MNPEEIMSKVHWLGHDGIRIEGSQVVYFDPYQISTTRSADLIFVSHEHFDHCSV